MARVNITVPDELFAQTKAAGLNVSRVASAALAEELERRLKVDTLRRYLADLDTELGPISDVDAKAADEWLNRQPRTA